MIEQGDEVICIDDSIQSHTLLELSRDMPEWVERGKEYVVRGVFYNEDIVTSITLENVVNPEKYFRLIDRVQEPAFRLDRFRKKEKAYIDPYELEETKVVNLEIEDYSYSDYSYQKAS